MKLFTWYKDIKDSYYYPIMHNNVDVIAFYIYDLNYHHVDIVQYTNGSRALYSLEKKLTKVVDDTELVKYNKQMVKEIFKRDRLI